MDCIWRTRGEWNRNLVCDALAKVFNDTLVDMNAEQEFMEGSWGRKAQSGGMGNPFTQDSN
jgi:hypothetical protein